MLIRGRSQWPSGIIKTDFPIRKDAETFRNYLPPITAPLQTRTCCWWKEFYEAKKRKQGRSIGKHHKPVDQPELSPFITKLQVKIYIRNLPVYKSFFFSPLFRLCWNSSTHHRNSLERALALFMVQVLALTQASFSNPSHLPLSLPQN